MLDRNEYMPLQYLVKQKWSGSYQGMRFMLQKKMVMPEKDENPLDGGSAEQELDSGEMQVMEPIPVLEAVCWKEPYSYEATPDERKTVCRFPLTEDGRLEAIEWLEQQYEERKEEWIAARKWDWEQ